MVGENETGKRSISAASLRNSGMVSLVVGNPWLLRICIMLDIRMCYVAMHYILMVCFVYSFRRQFNNLTLVSLHFIVHNKI
jgi:hypothetical protein